MSFLNTVNLSSNYPHTADINLVKKFRVNGTDTITFNLQEIENNSGNNLTINKILFNYGDGTSEYIDSTVNLVTSIFEPLSSVSHTYYSTISSLDNVLSGSATFFYMNGFKTTITLVAFYNYNNVIETQPNIVSSSSFTKDLSSFNIIAVTDKMGNLDNKIIRNKTFTLN
tara:strand:+ start:7070 stop:7579 length:510 start_codon:yes stop_codon:yes gene_type:complete